MKRRTHFKHTIDHLDALGESIETMAGVDAVKRWPRERIILRQGARIVRDSRHPRPAWSDKGRQIGR
jgi:hypothetical protein